MSYQWNRKDKTTLPRWYTLDNDKSSTQALQQYYQLHEMPRRRSRSPLICPTWGARAWGVTLSDTLPLVSHLTMSPASWQVCRAPATGARTSDVTRKTMVSNELFPRTVMWPSLCCVFDSWSESVSLRGHAASSQSAW